MAKFQKCMTSAILKHGRDRGNDAQTSLVTGIGNVYLLPFVNISNGFACDAYSSCAALGPNTMYSPKSNPMTPKNLAKEEYVFSIPKAKFISRANNNPPTAPATVKPAKTTNFRIMTPEFSIIFPEVVA
ncbi:hypothetical protein AB6Q56_11930 [Dechloromonas sp. ARDL1]|uniref:hypothetical protein n=1 Tax=Dechloromonas sp. ARDL1 TaxID=3322121 RepID=UPI003DA6FAE9